MREKDLEDVLFHHPYLIDAEFAGITPRRLRRQVGRGRSRLDLLFDLPEGLCIAELKITRLNTRDVEQLVKYCREWGENHTLAPRHFLIGKKPPDDKKLREAVEVCEFKINLLYLGEHLPTQLVFDDDSRLYRAVGLGETPVNLLELSF